MHTYLKRIVICITLTVLAWGCFLIRERRKLSDELIRLHIVAASDSQNDQTVKLMVRDAVLRSIQDDLQKISDISEAKQYLQDNLTKIQTIVNATLAKNGFPEVSAVSFCKEPFPIRHYDTFSLPAGVYNSLRIIIGEGNGQNWWCVAFPVLCIPATSDAFRAEVVGAGFSTGTAEALTAEGTYSLRFYCLDRLGELENIFLSEKILPCLLD